jgi:hypothetical protein
MRKEQWTINLGRSLNRDITIGSACICMDETGGDEFLETIIPEAGMSVYKGAVTVKSEAPEWAWQKPL